MQLVGKVSLRGVKQQSNLAFYDEIATVENDLAMTEVRGLTPCNDLYLMRGCATNLLVPY